MSKVKIGTDNDLRVGELQRDLAQIQDRATDLSRRYRRIQKRIRIFYDTIDFVQFSPDREVPEWASDWLGWLLDGKLPTPQSEEPVESDPDPVNPADEIAPTGPSTNDIPATGASTEEPAVNPDSDPDTVA